MVTSRVHVLLLLLLLLYQESDRTCPCKQGYLNSGNAGDAGVKKVYGRCNENRWRNQHGLCWNQQQWDTHCKHQVCRSPDDYLGVEKLLGLCKCRTDNLNEICDEECRDAQRDTLQLFCPEEPFQPLIRVTSSGDTLVSPSV